MKRLDMTAEFGKGHRVGIGRPSFWSAVERRQHGNHCCRVEALYPADLGQRLFATATVSYAEMFKNARAGRYVADNFSNGGFDVDRIHGHVLTELQVSAGNSKRRSGRSLLQI